MTADRTAEAPMDSEAASRLAAAYLDMWEAVVSAHALMGPPTGKADHRAGDGDAPTDE